MEVETLSCSDYLDVEFAFADVDLKAGWVQYLPGIIATLALLMINAIRRCSPWAKKKSATPLAML